MSSRDSVGALLMRGGSINTARWSRILTTLAPRSHHSLEHCLPHNISLFKLQSHSTPSSITPKTPRQEPAPRAFDCHELIPEPPPYRRRHPIRQVRYKPLETNHWPFRFHARHLILDRQQTLYFHHRAQWQPRPRTQHQLVEEETIPRRINVQLPKKLLRKRLVGQGPSAVDPGYRGLLQALDIGLPGPVCLSL